MEMEASAVKKKIILNKPSSYKGGQKSQNEAKTKICITRGRPEGAFGKNLLAEGCLLPSENYRR